MASHTCKNCCLPGHTKETCKITVRRRPGRRIRLKPIQTPPHSGRKNFWEGVLTRTRMAQTYNLVNDTIKLQEQKIQKLEEDLKKYKNEEKKREENCDICAICQDKCYESEENKTACGHVFHTGCLLGWLKTHNTCPCCRTELYDKPEVPDQNDLENLVENIFSTHLQVDPTENRNVEISSVMLYNLGDEVARLSVEHALDIDLDWFINFEEENNDEDTVQEDMEDTVEVVITEDSSDDEGEGDGMLLTIEERLAEEKTPESSSDMELSTPPSPPLTPINLYANVPLPDSEITPLIVNEFVTPTHTPYCPFWTTTYFEEWQKFGDVLHELNNRNRFMRAWNAIDEAALNEAANAEVAAIHAEVTGRAYV